VSERFIWAMVALLGAAATPVGAQDAITPDVCAVTAAELALPPGPPANLTAVPFGIGRLWRVTAPGGRVSHVWGSLHSSDRAILNLPEQVAEALASSRVLVMESDPRPKSRTEIAERALQAGVWLAPSDQPWDKPWLDGPARAWAEERIAAMTQDDGAFAALTDMGLAYLLMSDPCEDFAAPALPSQDMLFLLKAHQAGLAVASLEYWDAFLTEMSQPERAEEVRALARINAAFLNPDGYHDARAETFRLYQAGRIADLRRASEGYLATRFGGAEAARLTELADRYLIDERNRRFVRAMGRHLDEGGAMVVVGALHLGGEAGLLALLRDGGYEVERIRLPGEAE